MTIRNKRKLAALNKENCEKQPRSNLAQNSSAPRSQEDYITQVSEEIEGRVTKRLSKEFSRTENRILGALARLYDFLMNPLLPGHSGNTPEPSRNALNTSQGTNEDDSQNDPRPEAGLFHGQMTQNSGPKDGHDMVTGVQRERERESLRPRHGDRSQRNKSESPRHGDRSSKRERLCGHDMVTGATQQIGKCHDLTGVHQESHTAPLVHLQGSRRETALPVNRISAVKTPLRRSKQTKVCWPFNS